MNPYLKRLREKYEALRGTIEGVQTRAAEEDRDLTDDELRSVQDQGEQAKKIAGEIESLTEIENRSAAVRQLAASVADDTTDKNDTGTEKRTALGITTRDRDPGHYTRSGEYGFFHDLYRSKEFEDADAARRLAEHTRSLTSTGAGSGIVPPRWLTDEYAELARQGRALASSVRNIPLGDDPRPLTLPKQTSGADEANPAQQGSENAPTPSADKFATDVDTVAPKPTTGKQIVSRQLLEMSSPAVDALIYGDMIAEYNRQIEAAVGAAVLTAAGTPVVAFANETGGATTNFTDAGAAHDSVIDLSVAVRNARKMPANILAMGVGRWGAFKKLKDGDGRPLIPTSTSGPVNVAGVGSVQADGVLEDLAVIVTDGIGVSGTYPDYYVALRASDTLLFEGSMMRFRYEERSGPESIELGIWAYSAVLVRYAGQSTKRAEVTAGAA